MNYTKLNAMINFVIYVYRVIGNQDKCLISTHRRYLNANDMITNIMIYFEYWTLLFQLVLYF
jgi:hypothetical protein